MDTQLEYNGEELLVYLRKSRSDDPGQSVEDVLAKHEHILSEWIASHSTPVPPENWYREVVSGETITDRPQFQRLLRRMESPDIKAVLVVEVQRLGRGDLEDAGRIIKLFRYTNTLVLTPNRSFDIESEFDREFFKRELERGNDYLEYTKRILKRGKLESSRAGYWIHPRPPVGYEIVPVRAGRGIKKILRPKEGEADIIRHVFEMRAQGAGMWSLTNYLDANLPKPSGRPWGVTHLHRILSNPVYTGKMVICQNTHVNQVVDGEIVRRRLSREKCEDIEIVEGRHEGIVSEELFEKCQARRTPPIKAGRQMRNPLCGLLYCECGLAMIMLTNGRYSSAPHKCGNSSVWARRILPEVEKVLIEALDNLEAVEEQEVPDDSGLQIARRRLSQFKERELREWEMLTSGFMAKDIFEKLNQKTLREIREAENEVERMQADLEEAGTKEASRIMLHDAIRALRDSDADVEAVNVLLKECIERIIYSRKKGEEPVLQFYLKI